MSTLVIDVINKTIPMGYHQNIPIINKPNPCYGYTATATQIRHLIQLSNYWIYEAGTDKLIDGTNYYDYFPEEGGGGYIPVDTQVDPTSTNPVQNSAIYNFVNSSVATNTAYYISDNGDPFTSVEDLEAYSGEVSNNDYAFVTGVDESGNTYYDRYKATVVDGNVTWAKEYRLNNSSFTSAQWAAIQSGITADDKTHLNELIAKVAGIKLTENNCIEMNDDARLYISSTTPTGTIPEGSFGIGF